MNEDIKQELEKFAYDLGGDLFGVADLGEIKHEIEAEYGAAFSGLDRALSIAVFFPKLIVNELAEGPTHTYLTYYDALNARLNDIALRISNLLHKKGFKAYPIPSSQRMNDSKLSGIFSHRLAASRAGLGWIGKSCSLINPQVGPRLRLVTILTDAPLITDQPIENRCGDCTLCQEACPPQAIKGVVFQKGQALEQRFDAQACHDYLAKVRHSFGKRICGRCLAVCPWGK